MYKYYYKFLTVILLVFTYIYAKASLPLAAIWVDDKNQKALYFGLLIDQQYVIFDSDNEFYNDNNFANIKVNFLSNNKLIIPGENNSPIYKIEKYLNIGEFTFLNKRHKKIIIFKLDRPVLDATPVKFSNSETFTKNNCKINYLSFFSETENKFNINNIDTSLSNLPLQSRATLYSFIEKDMKKNISKTGYIEDSIPLSCFPLGCFDHQQKFMGWPFYRQDCRILFQPSSLSFKFFYVLNANYINQKIKEDQKVKQETIRTCEQFSLLEAKDGCFLKLTSKDFGTIEKVSEGITYQDKFKLLIPNNFNDPVEYIPENELETHYITSNSKCETQYLCTVLPDKSVLYYPKKWIREQKIELDNGVHILRKTDNTLEFQFPNNFIINVDSRGKINIF